MRKATYILFASLLAITIPGTASAQGISVGVKGGLNLADVSGGDFEDTKRNNGLMIGGFVNLDAGMFSIQPEAYFSQKGARTPSLGNGFGGSTNWNLTYLEVPVLLRLGLGLPGAPLRPVLFAGPAAGLLLSSKVKGEAEGISIEADVKDETKSVDIGGVVGAGLEFGALQIDARYTLGLTDIADEVDASGKNRTISLLVGFSFAL